MEKQALTLGKRKKSEPESNPDDLDSVVMSAPRNKIQKLSHSNTRERESEKTESESLILELSFVQPVMTCACGYDHTITLSDDGTAHAFGSNEEGALGLGHNNDDVLLPTPIPNLPKINMVSCGSFFTVFVDDEGFIWSFGSNDFGQLGTGNTTNFNVPQKIEDIPPVLSVSCGFDYTLMITTDSNLWSWGYNEFGQLCNGNQNMQLKPQKTQFSNISKISCGSNHSLFQNEKGEIFSCGNNEKGQCGLGHFNRTQIIPSLILNAPPNIVHFVCGFDHSLFLDSEGNVFSVGHNEWAN